MALLNREFQFEPFKKPPVGYIISFKEFCLFISEDATARADPLFKPLTGKLKSQIKHRLQKLINIPFVYLLSKPNVLDRCLINPLIGFWYKHFPENSFTIPEMDSTSRQIWTTVT